MPEGKVTGNMRYRITINRGMEGAISYEATVDAENWEMEDVLFHSDALVEELEKRYPITEVQFNGRKRDYPKTNYCGR